MTSLQLHQRPQKGEILPGDRDIGCLDIHPKFPCNLEHPSLAYRSRLSDRLSSEAGNFEGLPYLVLTKFVSCFLLHPPGSVRLVYCQQLRQGQFFAQWLAFAIKIANSLMLSSFLK